MSRPQKSGHVTSPLRLLILSAVQDPSVSSKARLRVASLLTSLTESKPSHEQISFGFAGYTTHASLEVKTKYYHASIGIWCDEVGPEWKDTMTGISEEVREVRSVIGAICFVLEAEDVRTDILEKAFDVIEQVEEFKVLCEDEIGMRDVPGVVMLIGEDADEKLDEVESFKSQRGIFGWEIVSWKDEIEDSGPRQVSNAEILKADKNEYGEKVGIERLREILEIVPWTDSSANDRELDAVVEEGDEIDWTTSEQHDLDKEMVGLKLDLHRDEGMGSLENGFSEDDWPELQGGAEDVKVEQLQGLMERLIATREAASELSGAEKENFAKREVERIMKEMG